MRWIGYELLSNSNTSDSVKSDLSTRRDVERWGGPGEAEEWKKRKGGTRSAVPGGRGRMANWASTWVREWGERLAMGRETGGRRPRICRSCGRNCRQLAAALKVKAWPRDIHI